MKESSFWNTLRKKMVGEWQAYRIEPGTGTIPGIPDVVYAMSPTCAGWIELKYLKEFPKRASTVVKIKHYSPNQRLFLRKWGKLTGKAFLFCQVGKEYFLFDWETAQHVGGSYTQADWRENALCVWSTIDVPQLKYYLAGGKK
jgi:hypothetical protein